MSDELRSKTVKAMSHLGLGGAVGKVLSLGTTLLLARFLSIGEYGLMGLAMVVISFISVFSEVGIGTAIVQRKELDHGEVNGCFAVATLTGLVLSLVTMACSPLVASFYKEPHLGPMIMVLSSGFLLSGIGSVPTAYLRREMHFKVISVLSILAILVQSITAIVLASIGFGVWSLVWSFVVAATINNVGAYLLSSWRPVGVYKIRAAWGLVSYGFQVVISRMFWHIYTNADKAIIGWALNTAAVGIYNMAFALATLPNSQITSMVVNVAAPVFSKLQHDFERLNQVTLKLTRGVAYATYPVLIGMLATANELVLVALGPKWMEVTVPFRALCLMGLIKSVDPLLSQILINIGHANKLSVYTAICGVAMSLGIIVGARFDGLFGVSVVWIVVYPILSIKLLRDVGKLTGLRMLDYYKALWPVLLGASVMGLVVTAVRYLLLTFLKLPTPATLGIEVVCGAFVYVAWVIYLDREGLDEMRQVMVDLGVPAKKLERWPFVRSLPA